MTGRIHYMMDEAEVDFVLTEMQFAPKLYHEIGFADMEDYMKLEDQQYADQRN